MWARSPRGRFAWASGDPKVPPPGQTIPPPIPGGSAVYYAAAENGVYPWALGGWAGARNPLAYLVGGIVAAPDPAAGTVNVTAWWPYASALLLVRVHPDGSRVPVRGGYSVPVSGSTRRNYAANPSIESGLNGWLPKDGNPTLTQGQGDAAVGSSFARATTAAGSGGANGVGIPTSLTGAAPMTIGFAWRGSSLPTSLTVKVAWTDEGGGALATSSAALTADQLAAGVNQWTRPVVTLTPPSGAVTPTVSVVAAGMPTGSTLDLDAVTIESGVTSGSAFDGTTLGAVWVGTPGLSDSILAPVVTVVDRECPLDVDVSYTVTSPGITGGRATSAPVQLASQWRTWLTHPDTGRPLMSVDVKTTPALEFGAEQGVFFPLGARRPVVISAKRRQAATGTLVFNVNSFAERDQLADLLDDLQPVLLRAPAAYGLGLGMWLSLGTVTEDRGGRKAYQDAATLSAPFYVVDAPDPVS